jgi:organic radical activating enzyme
MCGSWEDDYSQITQSPACRIAELEAEVAAADARGDELRDDLQKRVPALANRIAELEAANERLKDIRMKAEILVEGIGTDHRVDEADLADLEEALAKGAEA